MIRYTKILLERTDENNVMTAQDIVKPLSAYDVPANRKSIYDDIEALQQNGLDKVKKEPQSCGSRLFNSPVN